MNKSLKNKLILITTTSFILIFILLIVFLPKLLIPIYENNVYKYLRQPHSYLKQNINNNTIDDIAYFFVSDNVVFNISPNYNEIVSDKPEIIINQINSNFGKIKVNNNTYYYYATNNSTNRRITLTNDSYIKDLQNQVSVAIIPITFVSFLLMLLVLYLWANKMIKDINLLKNKIDNIENIKFDHEIKIKSNDELSDLEKAIEATRKRLISNEKEKNEMFQNISHDLKTPIAVIKSHIEAIEDKMLKPKEGINIIKEQSEKLQEKVNSLLYLNKLNHYENKKYEIIKLEKIIKKSIKKFKYQNKNIIWNLVVNNDGYTGNEEMWEVVIDNILENFIRYAKEKINITMDTRKITFYNDGKQIDKTILSSMFEPYQKSHDGNFGLGLSIVKKTIDLFGYKITATNLESGVKFIID